jgi:hypothetical protein
MHATGLRAPCVFRLLECSSSNDTFSFSHTDSMAPGPLLFTGHECVVEGKSRSSIPDEAVGRCDVLLGLGPRGV